MVAKTNFFDDFNNSSKEVKIEENYFNLSDEFVLLSISGIVDTYNSSLFLDTIKKFLDLKQRRVLVMDLNNVNYMSSTGIGAFVELLKYCTVNKTLLYLMKLNINVVEVFKLLGFSSFFNFIIELKDIKEEKIIRSLFPIQSKCIYCSTPLTLKKVGSFRCPSCSNTFRVVEQDGKVNIEKRS